MFLRELAIQKGSNIAEGNLDGLVKGQKTPSPWMGEGRGGE